MNVQGIAFVWLALLLTLLALFGMGTGLTTAEKETHMVQAQVANQGRIVFQSERDGNAEIYVMDADGSNMARLTTGADDRYPRWSPDGTRIAFESERDGNREVYVMNVDGSNQTLLTSNAAYDSQATWSPDGTRIAFQSYRRRGIPEIYVMDADGSNQTRLTSNSYDWAPTWSPDGTRIAFNSGRDGNAEIYVMNADGSNQTRLTTNAANDWYPAWSPNGTRIAFGSERDGNREIYVMNADGSNQTRLTTNAAEFNATGERLAPAWSPDGLQIVFSSDREDNTELYVINADGSNMTRLTFTEGKEGFPDWTNANTATPTPTPTPPPADDLAIVAVNPRNPIANTRYLAGIPVANKIEVEIGWADNEPSHVTFQLNEQSTDVPAPGATVSHTYNMGSDLEEGLNILTITAHTADGQASEPRVYQITSIPQPAWMSGMLLGGLMSLPILASGDTDSEAQFQASLEIPVRPYSLTARRFGPTDAGADINWKIQGSLVIPLTCSDEAEINVASEVGAFTFLGADFALQGYGSLSEESGPDTCLLGDPKGTAGARVNVGGTIYKKPVIIMVTYLNPVVGQGVNETIEFLELETFVSGLGELYLDGKGSVGFDMMSTIVDEPYYIVVEKLNLNGTLALQAGYRADMSVASIDVYMGGSAGLASAIERAFSSEDDLTFDSITLTGEAGAKIRVIWVIDTELKGQVEWSYPPSLQTSVAASEEIGDNDWQWIEYDGTTAALSIDSSAARVFDSIAADLASTSTTEVTTGTLINDLYQYPETSMAVYTPTNNALTLWVQPDDTKPASQAHEIFYSFRNGTEWTTPAPVTNDTLLDDSPEVAWIDENTAVAVWHRLSEPASDESTWSNAIASKIEIATATYDVTTDSWSEPTLLTSNDGIDILPRLSTGQDGKVWAAWRYNPDGKLLGDAASRDDILVATYENGWRTPETALAGLPGVFDVVIGSGDGEVTIAFSQVISETGSDPIPHIFSSTWNGIDWSDPEQLTIDPMGGTKPHVLYNVDNQPVVIWLSDDSLHLRNLVKMTTDTFLLPSNTEDIAEYQVIQDNTGDLAIVFVTANLPQNIYVVYYDRKSNIFSRLMQLTDSQNSKADLTTSFRPNGRLVVGYAETEIIMTNQTATDPITGEMVEYAVPTEGSTDLMILATSREAGTSTIYLPMIIGQ